MDLFSTPHPPPAASLHSQRPSGFSRISANTVTWLQSLAFFIFPSAQFSRHPTVAGLLSCAEKATIFPLACFVIADCSAHSQTRGIGRHQARSTLASKQQDYGAEPLSRGVPQPAVLVQFVAPLRVSWRRLHARQPRWCRRLGCRGSAAPTAGRGSGQGNGAERCIGHGFTQLSPARDTEVVFQAEAAQHEPVTAGRSLRTCTLC